jgi:Kef-type K+ transport system membrane component KefB
VTFETLLIVGAGAVLAPLLVEFTPGLALPVVVVELLLGILAGPVLGIAEAGEFLRGLAGLGLAFLFFLAGMEIDLRRIGAGALRTAAGAWVLSLAIALAVAGGLAAAGVATPFLYVAAALSTTALGTLLPILRDGGVLPTPLGRHALAAGACGELLPILLMSVVLTGAADRALTAMLLVAFMAVAAACAVMALRLRPPRLLALLDRSMHSASQLPVRGCMLFLVALLYLAQDFGLDVILGAFAAGMVVGLVERDSRELGSKLEAIGFGFLVPVFFITSGMTFDLDALSGALPLVPLFLAALLLVRGLPALLLQGELDGRERTALALYASTTLPLVVAITAVATAGGHMDARTAAALVGAGMLSVVVFPAVALALPSLDRAARVPLGA